MYIDICIRIGNMIMERNLKAVGLLNGSAGNVIFFYHLAKETSEKKYLKYANSLVDEIYKQFNFNSDFQSGVAGTGWCLEYLIQNNFCKGNANKILEDIDTKIFRTLYEQKEITLDLKTGFIGYLQYQMMRLKNKKNYKSDAAQINIELFKLIINKIDRLVPSQILNLTKDIKFNLLEDIYILLWSFNDAFTLNIYSEKILNMFRQWEIYLISYLPSLHINRLYLATVLLQTNQILKSEKINKHIRTLLHSIDCNQFESEIDLREINNVQFGYLGFLFILNRSIQVFDANYPNYQQLIDFKRKITNQYNNRLPDALNETKNTDKPQLNTKYGLAEGWAGVGLLLLLNPGMYEII